jgi:uncharacterized coiled-coil protein SlyX
VRCPYCISEINDEAVACPVCRRDLYLFKPLLARIEALEKQVAAQDAVLSQWQESASEVETDAAMVRQQEEPDVMLGVAEWLSNWLLPLGLLLLAHGLIVLVYDLNTVYLRVVSLLIPLPFGLLLVSRVRRPRWLPVVLASSLAALAVLGMSALTALVDGSPILPVGMREWREFLEYAASIGLSYATGLVIGRMSRRRAQVRRVTGLSVALAHLVSDGAEKTEQFQAVVKKFNDLGGTLTAAATTAAAIYTGLQGVIGK